jgi:hypothetical protein
MGVLDDFMVDPRISMLGKTRIQALMHGASCCNFRYSFEPR